MINTAMRQYNYFNYGEPNEYGQATLIVDEGGAPVVQGSIKMAINITTQRVQDNINYKGAIYIGLTHDAKVDDTYVIDYKGEHLKVLYVNPNGRLKQVFMVNI